MPVQVFPRFPSASCIYFEFSVDCFIGLSSSFVIGLSWRGRRTQDFREAGSRNGSRRSLLRGFKASFLGNCSKYRSAWNTRGLFGVHLLILHFKFQFSKLSIFLNLTGLSFQKKISLNKMPKNHPKIYTKLPNSVLDKQRDSRCLTET